MNKIANRVHAKTLANREKAILKEATDVIENLEKQSSFGPHEYRIGSDIIDDVTSIHN